MTMSRFVPLSKVAASFVTVVALAGCQGGSQGDGSGGGSSSETPRFVSLGTAPVGGAFYNVGAAIANALQNGRDTGGWRQVTAESTGGTLENLRRLDNGDIQLGMANSSITYFAVRGEEGFEKPYEVKSVMTLFPLIAMFVSKQGAGVESIQDLKGKRVVVGPQGAGFEYFVRPILREHGVNYDDFEDVYAGMQTSVGYLQDGSVAATFLGGGLVSPAITSAASSMDVFLVPYGDQQRAALAAKFPSFNEVTVPAGTYRGQPDDFAGLNVGSAHLLVRSDAEEEFVYRVTKVIYEARAEIAETHAGGKSINPSNVIRDTGTEFHPGAIRYYQEIGIWPTDAPDAAPEDAAAEDAAGEAPEEEASGNE
jgi:TRAP transporter TAXI family solute receptor